MDSTPAYRQKQYDEGVKRITEMKRFFLHLTKEQQVKILVAMSSVPQINAAPVPIASPVTSSAPVDAPASSIYPATPSAPAIANDETGGESARDTISTTMTDALTDDDMWV